MNRASSYSELMSHAPAAETADADAQPAAAAADVNSGIDTAAMRSQSQPQPRSLTIQKLSAPDAPLILLVDGFMTAAEVEHVRRLHEGQRA